MTEKKSRYALLLTISFIWGAQFVFNKAALESFSSILIAASRASIGMLTLSIILSFLKPKESIIENVPISFKLIAQFFLIGLFEATIPFYLVAWGQHYVSSAVAALLIGTIPIMVIILLTFLRYEKITLFHIISVILGFLGVVILFSDGSQQIDLRLHILGELAVLGGAFSFAASLILIKKLPPMNYIRAARNILFWSSIQMLPFLFVSTNFMEKNPGILAFSSILVLGVFCAGLVYVLYIRLIVQAGAAFASFTNYLVPLLGIILGVCFFKEELHWNMIISMLLILSALLINEIKN